MRGIGFCGAAVLCSFALSSCSTQMIQSEENSADKHIGQAAQIASRGDAAATASAKIEVMSFRRSKLAWLGGHVVTKKKPVELPEALKKHVTLNKKVMQLTELTDEISADIGIPVRISAEVSPYPVTAMAAMGSMGGGMPGVGGAPGAPMPGVGGMMGAPGMMGAAPGMMGVGGAGMMGGTGMMTPVLISYSGTAAGLLDVIAGRFGVFWKYENGGVLFYSLETKTFVLSAVPGDSSLTANVTGGGSNSSSGSGSAGTPSGTSSSTSSTSSGDASGSHTGVNSSLSVWSDINKAVKSMLSQSGSAVITPSTGTVMVTDNPVYVKRVGEYIARENEVLSKQVLMQVKVLSVTINDSNQYGVNWNAVFNSLSKNVGITATNAFPTGPGVGSLSMSVLNSAAAGTNISQFAGSSAVIDALSTQGKVTLVTSATIVTLNNQPVPVQVGTQTSYLASVATTNTANVGTTSMLTPGVVQTGFNMNLLPHLLDDGRVLLQFAVNISSLNKMNSVTSGGNTIEIPEVDSRDFLQRVSMHSGQTLILSGFEQTSDSVNKQGIGSADNVALGGGVSSQKSRNIVVIMITPVSGD